MEQIGEVVAVEGNMAVIRLRRESACGENCAMCGGCGGKKAEIRMVNTLNALPGQRVKIANGSSKVLFLAFLTYIVPLLIMALVYGILQSFIEGTFPTVAAVCSMVLGFFVCNRISNSLAKKESFQSKMLCILSS